MKTIKDLKKMISEPASKQWFKKHGSKGKTEALKTKTKKFKKLDPHTQKMWDRLEKFADEEVRHRAPMEKRFGTFEERFKKFSDWKNKLGK